MWQAGKNPRRQRRNKAAPVLGAAGLSLSLASGAYAAVGDVPTAGAPHKTLADHQLAVDEEISDVSLATFYVFDKENAAPPRRNLRLAFSAGGCGCAGCGGCGCWTGTDYTRSVFGEQPSYPPPRKPVYRRHTHPHVHTTKNK